MRSAPVVMQDGAVVCYYVRTDAPANRSDLAGPFALPFEADLARRLLAKSYPAAKVCRRAILSLDPQTDDNGYLVQACERSRAVLQHSLGAP